MIFSIILEEIPLQELTIFNWLPYIVFLLVLALAYFFKNSRVFFINLFLLIFLLIGIEHISPYLVELVNQDLYNILMINFFYIFVPINLIFFSLVKERGIFSFWGLTKLIIISGQFLGFYLVIQDNLEALSQNYHNQLISWNFFVNELPTHHLSLLMLFFFIVVLVVLIIKDRDVITHSLVTSLLAIIISLEYVSTHEAQTVILLLLIILGLNFTIAILRSSYILAYKDNLTGLASRRALEKELLKQGSKFSVAMLDIDHFKKFNDKYGHDVGDQVLKMVASIMEKTSGGARVFRYGGEEFTLVFPGKKADECLPHLEDLRKRIANRTFYVRNKKNRSKKNKKKKKKKKNKTAKITVSIGVAEKNKEDKKPAEVVKSADKALYKAKNGGRNKVCKKN